jgi:hypothetical protein
VKDFRLVLKHRTKKRSSGSDWTYVECIFAMHFVMALFFLHEKPPLPTRLLMVPSFKSGCNTSLLLHHGAPICEKTGVVEWVEGESGDDE